MKLIEYRIQYNGVLNADGSIEHSDGVGGLSEGGANEEFAQVRCRNINSGYAKALKVALEPLGNGRRREIASIEFWKMVQF